MSKPVIRKPEIPKDHKIQGWIDDRFGVPNTVNIQAYKDILSWGNDYCYKEMLEGVANQIRLILAENPSWTTLEKALVSYWQALQLEEGSVNG